MLFNLNNFLIALSYTLDFVEMDMIGVSTNHGKRVAYISYHIAKELELKCEQTFDIVSLAILHDIGLTEEKLNKQLQDGKISSEQCEGLKEHCLIGEKKILDFPFLTDVSDAIKYHHEKYDGSGYFGLKGDNIPLLAQIIAFADTIDRELGFDNLSLSDRENVKSYIEKNKKILFPPVLCGAFDKISRNIGFWLDLKNEYINYSLRKTIPVYIKEMPLTRISEITNVFSKIIDGKSKFTLHHSQGLADKVQQMARYYEKGKEEEQKLIIAANLHDLGKLAIPNAILNKPAKLTNKEFSIIQQHPYLTRVSLQEINGFSDITNWASNHHEKLNEKGYPYGFHPSVLDFNSRLMACLDIYQALTEDRPYRTPSTHKEAIKKLNILVEHEMIDKAIVLELDEVFKFTD